MRDGYFYLAGPMTGIKSFNFPAFDRAASALRGRGYEIVSPAELDDPETRRRSLESEHGRAKPGARKWREFLRRDADIVMSESCAGVICLEDWETSRGARLETYIAEAFEKPIYKLIWRKRGRGWEPILEQIDRDLQLRIHAAAQEVV